jgi:hypothetical protein
MAPTSLSGESKTKKAKVLLTSAPDEPLARLPDLVNVDLVVVVVDQLELLQDAVHPFDKPARWLQVLRAFVNPLVCKKK